MIAPKTPRDTGGERRGQLPSPFTRSVLAKLDEAALTGAELPPVLLEFAEDSPVPDTNVAVMSPGGVFWLGRSGDIRTGETGNNIISLDMSEQAVQEAVRASTGQGSGWAEAIMLRDRLTLALRCHRINADVLAPLPTVLLKPGKEGAP
jgi:hypothetical protein